MPIPDRVADDPRAANIRATRAATRTAIAAAVPDVTDAELDAALVDVDQDALWDAERPRWTVELWDRSSPINGVPADQVLERRPDIPPAGDVFLVLEEGRVVMFQPHEPELEGHEPIPAGQGEARGLEHAELIVADRVANGTAAAVLDHIRTARGGQT
jgi:hypothetical protein